nr:hypothetical protein [Bifidobacterium sp. UTBIF-68]
MMEWNHRRPRIRKRSSQRLHRLRQSHRLPLSSATTTASAPISDLTTPPAPPIALTPLVACDPSTEAETLWHIALHVPELRRWIVANPSADAAILEFISQAGGPGVRQSLEILLESLEDE